MAIQITLTDAENIDPAKLKLLSDFLSSIQNRMFTSEELESSKLLEAAPRVTPGPVVSAFAVPAFLEREPIPGVVVDAHPPYGLATPPPPPISMNEAPHSGVIDPGPAQTPLPLVSPAPFPLGGVELDKDGVPYDGRIHTSTKSKNKDGTWRVKRGTDPEYLKQVTSELITAVKAPPAPVTAPSVSVAPPPPTLVAPPSHVAATPHPGITTFPDFMRFVTAGYAAGQFSQIQVVTELQAVGIPSLPGLSARPDFIPHLVARLERPAV